jgi:phospholipid-transporting ATPase
MQIIAEISISNGQPVIYGPLFIIVLITALKDLFEDLKRHRSDSEENNRRVGVFRDGLLVDSDWKELRVGEIIKV